VLGISPLVGSEKVGRKKIKNEFCRRGVGKKVVKKLGSRNLGKWKLCCLRVKSLIPTTTREEASLESVLTNGEADSFT